MEIGYRKTFQLPQQFQSIITPLGDIFILGGSDHNQKILGSIYCYEHVNSVLLSVGSMITPRSSFSCCVVSPYIYSFCGLSDDGVTVKAERYNTLTQKTQSLADSNYYGISQAVCSFGRNEIWKFGNYVDGSTQNKIEKYLIGENKWIIIDYKYDSYEIQFNRYSAATQINDQQIIVFGGYQKEFYASSRSWLIKLESNGDVQAEETWSLPKPNGFWSSQLICENGNIFGIQNAQFDKSNEFNDFSRTIVVLDQFGWHEL